MVVEARSVKSSCRQGHAPSEASRGASFPTSLASWAGVHVTPVSAPVFKWPCPLSESSLLSLIRIPVIKFRVHPGKSRLTPFSGSYWDHECNPPLHRWMESSLPGDDKCYGEKKAKERHREVPGQGQVSCFKQGSQRRPR